MDRIKLRLM